MEKVALRKYAIPIEKLRRICPEEIFEIKKIYEGIEVLTDISAGERQADGTFPENTVNYLVNKRLRELAKGAKECYGPAPEGF